MLHFAQAKVKSGFILCFCLHLWQTPAELCGGFFCRTSLCSPIVLKNMTLRSACVKCWVWFSPMVIKITDSFLANTPTRAQPRTDVSFQARRVMPAPCICVQSICFSFYSITEITSCLTCQHTHIDSRREIRVSTDNFGFYFYYEQRNDISERPNIHQDRFLLADKRLSTPEIGLYYCSFYTVYK